MRIGSVNFSPRPWSCIATGVFLLLFARLGVWQLDRAEMKAGLLDEIQSRQSMEEITSLELDLDDEGLAWRRARLSGVFQAAPLVLLDNRVRGGIPGYFVYSVFRATGGNNILVNRGWVQAMPRRDELPEIMTPAEPMEIHGSLKLPPRTGKLLADNTDEVLHDRFIRLQFLDLDHVNRNYDLDVVPMVLRLDEGVSASFETGWASPATGREKHLGYAFQWFAMATALAVIFVVLNSKRTGKNDAGE